MYEVVKLEEGRGIRQAPSYPNRHFTLFLSLMEASLRPAFRPLSLHISATSGTLPSWVKGGVSLSQERVPWSGKD